ncbi:hypothetical protein NK8_10320 [Caballeronia sp. NK8]|uniref:hypothetical protein n=1 Tax=Caballeronia sp. NK8 TaxID=140098 RepID=UPI001BB4AB50|nr:hypothetical protein [Caballeronia sp. NK8]BCQ22911.1 hypothetical protein NK8_10320 [Caballeronia sp. NK8]
MPKFVVTLAIGFGACEVLDERGRHAELDDCLTQAEVVGDNVLDLYEDDLKTRLMPGGMLYPKRELAGYRVTSSADASDKSRVRSRSQLN